MEEGLKVRGVVFNEGAVFILGTNISSGVLSFGVCVLVFKVTNY